MPSLVEAIATFARVAIEMPMAEHQALEIACQMVEDEAKQAIGDPGTGYGWPPLAASTLARKGADTPLLETGEMRDSIMHHVEGSTGYVGSDNEKALWHELGTVHVPPRSFLMGAAMHKEGEINEMTGRYFFAHLQTGLGLTGGYAHFSGQAVAHVGSAPPLDAAVGKLTGTVR